MRIPPHGAQPIRKVCPTEVHEAMKETNQRIHMLVYAGVLKPIGCSVDAEERHDHFNCLLNGCGSTIVISRPIARSSW